MFRAPPARTTRRTECHLASSYNAHLNDVIASAQALRTLSDDEDYAAGDGSHWDCSSTDASSDDGLLALTGVSTEGGVSGAASSTPPRCVTRTVPHQRVA